MTLNYFKNNGIEDWGGTISSDFKEFARLYKNMVKRICKKKGWELAKFNVGHYYCSWFIKNGSQYVYCSFGDVRHFSKDWYKLILNRVAKSDIDYTGGSNWYTEIENLEGAIERRFQEGK